MTFVRCARGTVLTAIFSTLGMSVWTFLASAVLGLPKQLAVVYIGVSQGNDCGLLLLMLRSSRARAITYVMC